MGCMTNCIYTAKLIPKESHIYRWRASFQTYDCTTVEALRLEEVRRLFDNHSELNIEIFGMGVIYFGMGVILVS